MLNENMLTATDVIFDLLIQKKEISKSKALPGFWKGNLSKTVILMLLTYSRLVQNRNES